MTTTIEYSGEIVTYTIPKKGVYQIECWGASGGAPSRELAGLGAYSRSVALLNKDDVLKILVAEEGKWDGSRGGGGGGSFVELQTGKSTTTAVLLCAAGGGGGYSGGDSGRDGYGAGISAGGGSSYFTSFNINDKSPYTLSGYEKMPQIDDSIDIGNFGNGHVRITEMSSKLYFLIKDGKNYLPTDNHFDVANNTFNDLSYAELINIFLNKEDYYNYYNMNNTFEKNNKIIKPSDYIDFKSCKIGVITDDIILKDKIRYIPSDINLSKSSIKVKEQIKDITYKNCLDVESTDKSYLEYSISDNIKYKNCSILDTEILKNFSNITLRFNNPEGNLSKIYLNKYEKVILNKINKYKFKCESDLLNTRITFNNDYDKVLINKLTKQKFKYSNDSLETF